METLLLKENLLFSTGLKIKNFKKRALVRVKNRKKENFTENTTTNNTNTSSLKKSENSVKLNKNNSTPQIKTNNCSKMFKIGFEPTTSEFSAQRSTPELLKLKS